MYLMSLRLLIDLIGRLDHRSLMYLMNLMFLKYLMNLKIRIVLKYL